MTVLFWDKPEKIMPIEEWKRISADGAPPGVYMPNMSQADAVRWKAKLAGKRSGKPWVEIRKTVDGSQLLVIVALNGYVYGSDSRDKSWHYGRPNPEVNVRISLNGPARMTFEEMEQLQAAVVEARELLLSL